MKRKTLACIAAPIVLAGLIVGKTYDDIRPVEGTLRQIISDAHYVRVVDRSGKPLSMSYQNRWNTYDHVSLYRIPEFLKTAFVLSEDKRFFTHSGVDWQARASALWQTLKSGKNIRGASTITEQVVRMIHPRPRTLWSKWLEGWEAASLEQNYRKADILEFYLNQIPYASNRRGIVQGAHYYFDRDLNTLSQKEMLALVVLARAPSSYDLYRHPQKIEGAILRLARSLKQRDVLQGNEIANITSERFKLEAPASPVNAAHFIQYVRKQGDNTVEHILQTTLDATLQRRVQHLLDTRLAALSKKHVNHGAVLVAEHHTGDILSWVVAGADNPAKEGGRIDSVITPRQPGSALKPFLYAMALDKGWNPATLIEDAPMREAVGNGLHRFKNYSNLFYGPVTLREALGNSLNIPALKTIAYVGSGNYLTTLRHLGFASLNQSADVYDEGLALGNGEVTLLELVQGYAVLAKHGLFFPLRATFDNHREKSKQIFSAEASSLIANILSDPWARRLEFGTGSVLNLPVQTAAKTGTSTDYRDAWAVGFDSRFVVGVWMGNLDQKPTDGITGSTGPALVLRSIFSELNKREDTAPLYLSPKLVQKTICQTVAGACYPRSEYFMAGHTEPEQQQKSLSSAFSLVSPTEGLRIAIDPRIPRELQRFEFKVANRSPDNAVEWQLNDATIRTDSNTYLWELQRGQHQLQARIMDGDTELSTQKITFYVK